MEHISNFLGHMDKDSSDAFIRPENWRHLENGDIMLGESEDGGELVNVKGNAPLEIVWSAGVPSVSPYTESPLHPYGTTYKIVGGDTIRNDIILFYANSANNNNIVDLLKYQEGNKYIRINIVYNKELGIRYTDKVHTVTRYENTSAIKVYFGTKNNEGNEPLQYSMVNLAPNVINGVVQNDLLQANYTRYTTMPPEGIGAIGGGAPNKAITTFSIISGTQKNGAYSYAYRYVNDGGNKSGWSPLSAIQYITSSPMVQGSQELRGMKTVGTYDDVNSGKGFEVTIPNSGNYTHVELVRVYYANIYSNPTCTLIVRKKATGTLMIIADLSQTTSLGSISLEEFSNTLVLQAPKTATAKDDVLFTANTVESIFDVDFDARAYSFNSVRQALLINEVNATENVLNGSLSNWKTTALGYAVDLDCINGANNINNDFNTTFNGHKYQSDGTTRGAEGPRVKIDFVDDTVPLATTSSSSYYNATVDAAGWVIGTKRLFQKDEIYRIGIILRDGVSRRSPVKWCCDLRMPGYYEIFGGSGNTVPGVMDATGSVKVPRVTVDTSGTPAEGLTVQVVYVKRNYVDRTVITEGFGTTLSNDVNVTYLENSPAPFFKSFYAGYGSTTKIQLISPGFHDLNGTTGTPKYFGLETPEAMFNKNLNLAGNRLDLIGYLDTVGYSPDLEWWSHRTSGSTLHNTGYTYWRTKFLNYFKPATHRAFNIADDTYVSTGSVGFVGGIKVEGRANTIIAGTPTVNNIGDACSKHYVHVPDFINPSGLDQRDIPLFKVRQAVIQYGGRGYKARLSNTYIPASDPCTPSSSLAVLPMYYGDTFLNVHEYQRTQVPISNRDDDNDITTEPYWLHAAETVARPGESSINLNMRYDDTAMNIAQGSLVTLGSAIQVREAGLAITRAWNYKDEITGTPAVFDVKQATVSYSPLNLYNSVFSRINDTEVSVALDDDYLRLSKYDVRIRYSDKKTNGEFYDSWLNFKALNFKDANTAYGGVNYLTTFNDEVFMWQSSAFAHVMVNPRMQTAGASGQTMIIGEGSTLHDFEYMSTDVGIQGINEAVTSLQGLYWLDNNKKKLLRFSNTLASLSDSKDVSSYLGKTVKETSEFLGTYDIKRDKVFLTVRNYVGGQLTNDRFTVASVVGNILTLSGSTDRIEMQEGLGYSLSVGTNVGEYILNNITSTTLVFTRQSGATFTVAQLVNMSLYVKYKDSYTLLFDEPSDSFRSFEPFVPSLYLRGNKEFYSSEDNSNLYEHNIGARGSFYGTIYPMVIDVVINTAQGVNKSFGAITMVNKAFIGARDMEDTLDYVGVENLTFDAVRVIGDRGQTPYMELYTKEGKIIGDAVGNIAPSNYTNSVRTIRDTNGLRIIPYPSYLYNVRHTLNEFRASLPRLLTFRRDASNRNITELVRGKQATIRLVFNNTGNTLIKLKHMLTHFNSSVDV